ncbi:DUF1491 family protein [Pelagibacterium lentulum]|uniref:DUF1491 family protein n=1 Tax=Pelagibacterium lentulum TaxID=2029865 RepID=A0A916RHQ4_9HYPH|nr:DUF1491 family protein [Pelagibacterium lentulum]GGA54701.1 hypothetical protein GCM10011499_26090 [Pelagibacterium lentulum]
MDQLRSDIWCAAFVRRHNDLGNLCVVARRGDPIAGQIWIEIDHLNGTRTLMVPASSAVLGERHGERKFVVRYDRQDPLTIMDRIRRETDFDPDLWVLAVETRNSDVGVDIIEQ